MMSHNQHVSLLFHQVNDDTLQSRIIDTLCYILVILGFIGNLLGLFIFSSSRRTWRISSLYVYLATCSSIMNLLCMIRYALVLHSRLHNILYELVGQTWWACKLYEFSFSFRIISSWITLFWMFERLLCVSTKLRRFFNRWKIFKLNIIIPIMFVIILLIFIVGPPVYMYQPTIILKYLNQTRSETPFLYHSSNEILDSTMNKSKTYCELSTTASVKWHKYFHELRFGFNHFTIRCFFSELIPTGAVILFNSYIIYHVVRVYRRLNQINGHQPRKEQSRTKSSMNIVLILHSSLFLTSLFSHIAGHFIVAEAHEAWWILLAILMNCSINFYIYCLSGKAFRNEIRRFIQQLRTRVFNRRVIRRSPQKRSRLNQRIIYEMSDFRGRIQL